jgi:Cellulase (glycosyl hydrolase family 5)
MKLKALAIALLLALAPACGFAQTCVQAGTTPLLAGTQVICLTGTIGLSVTTSSLSNAVVGAAYSATLAATGGTSPYAWSIASQNPNTQMWRYVTRAGVLYGTPQLDESGPVTVLVTDSTGATASATLTHTVTNSGSLAIASPTSLPNGTTNGAYFYQLISSGGRAPYQNWTITSSTGTNTWYLTPDGWLYGVPTTAETDTVTVADADITDASVSQTETIVVNSTINLAGIDSTLAAIKIPDGRAGTKYTHQLRPANGGTGSGQTFAVASGGFPAGTSMSSSGLITGTPTYSGNALVSVKVTDSGSNVTTAYPLQWNIPKRQTGTRPAGNTASGFYVSTAGDLTDPNGNVFIPRGINRDHYDASSSGYPTAGVNAVRYTMYYQQFRGSNPGSSQTATTYFGNAYSQHVANKQFPIIMNYYVPGTTTATTTTSVATYPATSAAWMVDNLATWVSSGLQNNAAFNIANEWGGSNSTGWRDAYIAVQAPITNISGTTITINLAAGSNPFAAAVNGGYLEIAGSCGVTPGAYAVTTSVGGSSPNWTVTLSASLSGYTSGCTLWGGAIGILRGAGFTDPIVVDSGGGGQDPYDLLNYAAAVEASDPLNNTVFSFHAYGEATNLQAAVTSVSSGANAVVTFNWAGGAHPFSWPGYSGTFLQVRNTGLYVTGVTGASGINGTQLAISNQSTSSPWTLTSGFTAGSSGSGGMGFDWQHVNHIASLVAALKSSGVAIIFGEFGPGRSIGPSPSLTGDQQVRTATEQNQIGNFYWAMDDNNLGGGATNNSWFGATKAGPGTYTVPSDLTEQGLDAILNPRHGITATAQPASSY